MKKVTAINPSKEIKKIITFILAVIVLLMLCVPAYATEIGASSSTGIVSPSSDDLMKFVNNFMERRVEVLVEQQKEMVPITIDSTNGIIRESDKMFSAEENTLKELSDRRDVLSKWGEEYSDYEIELTLEKIDTSEDSATLVVKELTTLFYEKINGDEPDCTAWDVEREFVFQNDSQGWTLVSQQLINDTESVPTNEATGVTYDEMDAALNKYATFSSDDESLSRTMNIPMDTNEASGQTRGSFSGSSAASYATTYWSNYNPNYRTFSGVGGDCTNFVSQAMKYGGWTDAPGVTHSNAKYWWYNSLAQTYSWVNVDYFHDFSLIHSKRSNSISTPRSLTVGCVLQVDFTNNSSKDHTMIVTAKSNGEIYLTYHTTNTLNKSFANLLSSYPNGKWVSHGVKASF
jgi:hypothetical protein